MTKWLPVGAAVGLVAAVVVAGVISGAGGDDSAADSSILPVPTVSGAVVTDPITTATYEAVETEATSDPISKIALDRTLSDGLAGDDVARVQTRLTELAFDPGAADGIYGTRTKQAVWAFEKLVMEVPRSEATGKVTPEMWDRMQDPITVKPRRPSGGLANHTEVYLPEQVLAVFHGDTPVLVSHVSSGLLDENGNPKEYCEEATYDTDARGNTLDPPETRAICALSKTPGGVFTYKRMHEGKRVSPLGGMWDPVYFNYGIAVHGAEQVPGKPASHGCIRLPMHVSDYYQGIVNVGERILVWDGKKEPEQQSENDMLPSFDYRDPNATTTTTSTTSTTTTTTTSTTLVPQTTTPPPTTKAPTSTAAPTAPTTTIAPTTTAVPATSPPISAPDDNVEPSDDL